MELFQKFFAEAQTFSDSLILDVERFMEEAMSYQMQVQGNTQKSIMDFISNDLIE